MAGNAWIYTSYLNVSDGTIDFVMDQKRHWVPASKTTPNPKYPAKDSDGNIISDPTDPSYEPQYLGKPNPKYAGEKGGGQNRYLPLTDVDIEFNFDNALLLQDQSTNIEDVRFDQGEYQKSWRDREVRLERVQVSVSYPAI